MQIVKYQNKVSLIEFMDELDTPNKNAGGKPSDRIRIGINQDYATNSKAYASIFLKKDELKLLAFDFMHRLNTEKYTFIRESDYKRKMDITCNNEAVWVNIITSKLDGSGKIEQRIKVPENEWRVVLLRVYSYINHKELLRLMKHSPAAEVSVSDLDEQESPQEEQQRSEPTITATEPQETPKTESEATEDDDPIIPTGKFQGKRLSEVNDKYKLWLKDNVKGKQWEPIKKALMKLSS